MNNLLLHRRMMMQAGGSPTPPTPPEGAIPFPFSVSASKQVYFSKGNLQWSATGGGTTSTTHATADGVGDGTWRFAENQWDFVGDANYGNVYGVGGDLTVKCNNLNSSSTYQGWQDTFQLGTSGYDGKVPYWSNNYVTGIDIANTNYDYGVYNAISNGGNQVGLWRMLTKDEWVYLINTRTTTSGIRYAKAKVNNLNGLIIVPDTWDSSIYTLNSTNTANAAFSTNTITLTDWVNILEANGCVFIFAGGNRDNARIPNLGVGLFYFSTTLYSNATYYTLIGDNSSLIPDNLSWSYARYGSYFRLVHDIN